MILYWQESGPKDAPTIIFLHGMGVSSWMWTEQVEALQSSYHCLTIDLPGSGKSHTEEWQSFAATAERVAEFIRAHANNGKAHIVGLSLGGFTAITLLANHPDVVDTVVVTGVSTTPLQLTWMMKGMMAVLPIASRWEPFIKMQAQMLHLPPSAMEAFIHDNKVLTAQTYKRVYDEVLAFQLPPVLANRSHRLLALAGDQEMKAIKDGLLDFCQIMPNATAALAPNAHHGWNGEHPQLFNGMIQAWVEGHPLPPELIAVRGIPAPKIPIPQVEH